MLMICSNVKSQVLNKILPEHEQHIMYLMEEGAVEGDCVRTVQTLTGHVHVHHQSPALVVINSGSDFLAGEREREERERGRKGGGGSGKKREREKEVRMLF